MKIEIIRETPEPPPVKEIQLTLTVAEAQQLKEALGPSFFWWDIYIALNDALQTNK